MKGRHTQPRAPDPGASLTIGQLAAQTGVSADTIRYYERDGVIPPSSRRGTGKYRQYTPADAERLRFVRRARDLGFSLDEVRELLSMAEGDRSRKCSEVDDVARSHLAQVNAKIDQLTALRNELKRLIAKCNTDASLAECTLLNALSAP